MTRVFSRQKVATTFIYRVEEFIFDHARYHELVKTSEQRRVVLILDIHRFYILHAPQ
jgi:hypothetical protein